MRNALHRTYQTIAAGIFLLLPLAVIGIIIAKVSAVGGPIFHGMAELLGLHGPLRIRLLAIAMLLVLCLLAGILVRAKRVSRSRDWLERNVLALLPGYEFIRQRMANQLGQDGHSTDRAVLVRIDDGWSPAFVMERGPDGRCVVFMPDVPQSSSGSVYIVEADQVKPLGVEMRDLDKCIRNYGAGLLAMEAGSKAERKTRDQNA